MTPSDSASARPGPLLLVTGIIFILLGLVLAGGGIWLLTLDGSWYYILAGLGMIVAGALVFKGRRTARSFLAFLLAATLIWSIVEVKFDWWQLLPRLDIWFAAAVWLLLPFVGRRLERADRSIATRDTGKRALLVAVWRPWPWVSLRCSRTTIICMEKCPARAWRARRRATLRPAWRPMTGRPMAAPAMATAMRRPRRSRRPTPPS